MSSNINSSHSSIFLGTVDNIEIERNKINVYKARLELLAKRIFLFVSILLQACVLAGVLAVVLLYCPIPHEALLISPFIAGILTALALLHVPTFNISAFSYHYYTNPTSLLGNILTLIFFGPLIYLKAKTDWTNYGDPIIANGIHEDLTNESFEKIYLSYKSRFSNLKRYGYITQDQYLRIRDINIVYKDLFAAKKIFDQPFDETKKLDETDTPFGRQYRYLTEEIARLEKRWEGIQEELKESLPQPPAPDLTKPFNRLTYQIHRYAI